MIFLLFLLCCKRPQSVPLEISLPEEKIYSLEATYYDSGKIKGLFSAPIAIRNKKESNELLLENGFNMSIFQEDTINISANYALYSEATKIILAKQNVFISTNKGEWLKTDEITYNLEKKEFYSPTYVQIKSKNEIITGKGFRSNEDLSNFEIYEITGKIKIPTSSLPSSNK